MLGRLVVFCRRSAFCNKSSDNVLLKPPKRHSSCSISQKGIKMVYERSFEGEFTHLSQMDGEN